MKSSHRSFVHSVFAAAIFGTALFFSGSSFAAGGFPDPAGLSMASTYPYSMIGRVDMDTGFGTGTVVTRTTTLTAAHVLYDEDDGWSTGVTFFRGLYGNTYLEKTFPDALHILSGYMQRVMRYGGDSARSFAFDLGSIHYATPPADGAFIGIRANPAALTGPAPNRGFGYGAEFHTGNDLLFVDARSAFRSRLGSYYVNNSFYVEAGMSGGPILAPFHGTPAIVAIMLSSSRPTHGFSSGVRVLDAVAARFIQAASY